MEVTPALISVLIYSGLMCHDFTMCCIVLIELALVMEFVENGRLLDFLRNRIRNNSASPPVGQLIKFSREIAQVLFFVKICLNFI